MDAFLINPTTRKKGASYVNSPAQNMSGDLIPIFLSDEIITVKAGKKAVEQLGVISKYADDLLFSRGYASEEEAASPVDDADFGFHTTSDTESTASIRETLSVEDLSDHANALQLCTKAQAVQYVSAGKAKVVSVPKLVDLPSTSRSVRRPDNAANFRNFSKPIGNIPRPSDVQNRSARSSSERSPASSSFAEQTPTKTIRRKPRLPPSIAAPPSTTSRSVRTQTPLADQRAEFVKYDASVSTSPPSSISPSKLKMPKLSPSFSLKPFSRSRRSNSSASNSSNGSEGRLDWWTLTPSPTSPDARSVPRMISQPMPKLVARGASERAPPIVLPDCPADYKSDSEVDDSPSWPLRQDSMRSSELPSALQHLRRKRESAVFVTTQV